jgi:hypothetical protein
VVALLAACGTHNDVVTGALGGMSLSCGPFTCTGCCDKDGNCHSGTANDVCGGGGSACSNCGAQVCETNFTGAGGQCVRCSASNCTGCCDGQGNCRPGNEVTACGSSGQCDTCAAGQTCQYQFCL